MLSAPRYGAVTMIWIPTTRAHLRDDYYYQLHHSVYCSQQTSLADVRKLHNITIKHCTKPPRHNLIIRSILYKTV